MYRRSLMRSATAAGLLPGAARAQSFPSKQLRLLVGAAAGRGRATLAPPIVAGQTPGARRAEGMDYGTSGVGSAGHLAGELLKARSGARLNHVPFRGGGPAMNDLVGGHVPSLIASAPTATAFMREGRIRALAATGVQRSPFDPDIPTIAEQGLPGYAATNWYAVVVSSKVPPEIVAALNPILTKALKTRGADGVRTTRRGDPTHTPPRAP